MFLAKLGIVYSFICICVGFYIYAYKSFIFMTSWCVFLHFFTFLHVASKKSSTHLTKVLLLTSWSIGWAVTLMFWLYVFPLIDKAKLPPPLQYISTHGGINVVMSILYLKSDIVVEVKDFKWPAIFGTTYLFGAALPLKFVGVIVYPHFFDKLIPTLMIIFGTFIAVGAGFWSGHHFKARKISKTS